MEKQSFAERVAARRQAAELAASASRPPFPQPRPGEQEGGWRSDDQRRSQRKDLKRASISTVQEAFGRSEVAPARLSLPEPLPPLRAMQDELAVAPPRKNIKDVLRNGGGIRPLDPEQSSKDRKFLEDIFCCFDPYGDGSGSLQLKEFTSLCKALGLTLTKSEVKALMKQLDLNGNGEIELGEFALFFNRANSRSELKKTVGNIGGSKNAYVRKLFDEFKHPAKPGVDEQGLLELARIAQVALDERELRLAFRRLERRGCGWLTQDDLGLFFAEAEKRPELLQQLGSAGRGNELFLQQVYEAFDTSQTGRMTELDLLAAALLLGVQVTEKGVGALLAKIDTDRDGTVSLDEFIAFFGQVAATEEFMDALQEFKTAGSRRTYVIAISTFLGLMLCVVGLGILYLAAWNTNTDSGALGLASTFLGMCVLLLVLTQTCCEAFILEVVLPGLMNWTFNKALKVGTAFVCVGLALQILNVLGYVSRSTATFGSMFFLLPVVVAAISAPFYYVFDKVGWLEPVLDIDSPRTPKVNAVQVPAGKITSSRPLHGARDSRPPMMRPAFEP